MGFVVICVVNNKRREEVYMLALNPSTLEYTLEGLLFLVLAFCIICRRCVVFNVEFKHNEDGKRVLKLTVEFIWH